MMSIIDRIRISVVGIRGGSNLGRFYRRGSFRFGLLRFGILISEDSGVIYRYMLIVRWIELLFFD